MPSSRKEDEKQLEEEEISPPVEAELLFDPEEKADHSGDVAESVDDSQSEQSERTDLVPTTALDRYLVEVRRYPFLSKEEEVQLFHEYRMTVSYTHLTLPTTPYV